MPVREKVYKIPSYLISTFLSFCKKICMAWNCSIKAPKCYMVSSGVHTCFQKWGALLNIWLKRNPALTALSFLQSRQIPFFKTQYLLKCIEICSPGTLMFSRSSVKGKQGRRSCVSFCFKWDAKPLREHQEQDWVLIHREDDFRNNQLHQQVGPTFWHLRVVHSISIRYWKGNNSLFGSHINTSPKPQKSLPWEGEGHRKDAAHACPSCW